MMLILPRVDSENSATMAVHNTVAKEARAPRHVHFDEKANRCYEIEALRGSPSLVRERWYNAFDYQAFERETHQIAMNLQSTMEQQNSWAGKWLRVYFTLRLARTSEEIKHVLDTTELSVDERSAGFQDHFLEPIYSDYVVRRASLWTQIHRLQSIVEHQDERERLIQEASRCHSHATRLYANLAGVVSASNSA